jgi:TonB family protein
MMSLLLSALLGAALQSAATPPVGPTPLPAPPAKSARAMGSLPQLFSTDDYPAAALRNGETGTVAVKLAIDRNGRVSQCLIDKSSGSSSLDLTTCGILQRRARFTPATDANGRAVEDVMSARIKWTLPVAPVMAFADRYDRIVLTHDKRGKISSCRSESSRASTPPPSGGLCRSAIQIATNLKERFGGRIVFAGRELVLQSGIVIGGREAARGIGEGRSEKLVTMKMVALNVDADGNVKCSEVTGNGPDAVSPCARPSQLKFAPLAPAATDRSDRHATVYAASFTRPIR